MSVKAATIKDSNFNFVAAGDGGCGHSAINTLSMMKSMDPEIYLGLDDYSYQNSPDCWINIIKSVGDLFKIAVGNHDAHDQLLKDYMSKFKLDAQYYSFNYLNAHFIALSTELDKGGEVEQLRFLKNDLWKTSLNHSIDWTIVFFINRFILPMSRALQI